MNVLFSVDNFQSGKNYVIEASAGTGKTYNITKIVNKLVNIYHYKLSEILIVTYTEKAAGELKDRIRSELPNENVDEANIYTIHSFCQNTIKEFGISAGLPLNLNVVSEEMLDSFIDRYLREGDILNDIISFHSYNDGFSFDEMKKVVKASLGKYYLNKNYEEDLSVITAEATSKDEDEAYKLLLRCKEAKSLEELVSHYPDMKSGLDVMMSSSEEHAKNFVLELHKKYKQNLNFNGTTYKLSSPKWSKNADERERLQEAFKQFYDAKMLFKKIDSPYKFLIKIYLKDIYTSWQKEKELNKYQTFDDMIRSVRECVLEDNSKLLEKLRGKYKYAIIDEFQDTNQLQFDIFQKVFMCDNHNIIVVGDPKQSIYGFQGADVEVYHKAKGDIKNESAKETEQGIISELSKNFRSTADMVDSCNKLFKCFEFNGKADSFTPSRHLNVVEDLDVHEVIYDQRPVKAFWFAQDDENLDEYAFAKIVVQTIVDCCTYNGDDTRLQVKHRAKNDSKCAPEDVKKGKFRNVSFKDFAVLARSRSEMNAIERALSQAGIPFLRYKDKNLFLGKECADWIALLNVLNVDDLTGRNRKLFKKVLFTSFFGKTLQEITNEAYDTDSSEEIKKIYKWRVLAAQKKWEELVDSILLTSELNKENGALSGLQALGIYKQIGSYCVSYLSNNHSLDDLIINLGRLSVGGESDDDEAGAIVEKSTDFDKVQIMTMHASKGLQFPIVIAAAGFKNPMSDTVFSCYFDEDGSDTRKLIFKTDKGSNQEKTIKNEKLEEFKRLFYVGYTRAEFIQIFPLYNSPSKEVEFAFNGMKNFMEESPDDYKVLKDNGKDYFILKDAVKKILEKNAKKIDPIKEALDRDNQIEVLGKIKKEKLEKSTFKYSYTSLSHGGESHEEEDLDDLSIVSGGLKEFDKSAVQINANVVPVKREKIVLDGLKGDKVGTALHEIFEVIDYTNYIDDIGDVIIEVFDKQKIDITNRIDEVKEMVDNVLSATLPKVNGSNKIEGVITLNTIGRIDVKAEVEFNFNLGDEKLRNYFNGFIDLLFRQGNYFSILDWKSDSLNENFTSYEDNSELKKHVDDTYSIQRVLYSYCLIKWLKGFYKTKSEEEIFNDHFGGVYYVFLRGCVKGTGNGVYCQTWASWSDLEKEFKNITNKKVWSGHIEK